MRVRGVYRDVSSLPEAFTNISHGFAHGLVKFLSSHPRMEEAFNYSSHGYAHG